MEATVKDTGEVINIINLYDDGTAETEYHSYIKVSKLIFDFDDNDSDMPSEKRMRYELAKAAMQGMCAGNNRSIDSFRSKDIRRCTEIANTMIYQLKESELTND